MESGGIGRLEKENGESNLYCAPLDKDCQPEGQDIEPKLRFRSLCSQSCEHEPDGY